MKIKRYENSRERTVLIALITNNHILEQVYLETGKTPLSEIGGPFRNRWANLIAGWCFEYWKKYKKAPGKAIQNSLSRYSDRSGHDESAQMVERFLSSLSGEYSKIRRELNEEYALDQAAELLGSVRLERISNSVSDALERGDTKRADELVKSYEPVSFGPSAWLNPFSNREIEATLNRKDRLAPMVEFRGDLGRFLSPAFERDGFIAFAGPEKRGKSFWLQEVVWLAMQKRRKVLYYVLGDMSENQVKQRIYCRMTGKPYRKKITHQEIRGIKQDGKDKDGKITVKLIRGKESVINPFRAIDVRRARKRVKMRMAMKRWPLRLRIAGANIITASEIENDIHRLQRDGFVPDVVVIDYADLLAPEIVTTRMDFRHQIDAQWKILRRISTENHLLMVTATQAASRAYGKWLLTQKDFSEDKRKNAHVTGMIGINQTPTEKRDGIYRLNWIAIRDGEWSEIKYVWTAGNLALGCPCFRSLL